ncbi:Hypp7495 [Branchiostoma lanceolatum]|uniref:Hypp7495 protein n=1 Tax=Branchiostoma lanceolatum TaxID=7740 RepID=A0A8K0EEG9_BRALA|nr:Hypp7495 [Branchiostoma lanceolatum]
MTGMSMETDGRVKGSRTLDPGTENPIIIVPRALNRLLPAQQARTARRYCVRQTTAQLNRPASGFQDHHAGLRRSNSLYQAPQVAGK